MAGISNFNLTWWYSSNTKLSLSFTVAGGDLKQNTGSSVLNYNNGLSASVDENYHSENIITNHPVESGVNISDYIIVQPKIITITGLLTAINTLTLFGFNGFNTGTGILDFSYLGGAIKFLINAADSRKTFTLTTGLYFGSTFFKIENVAIKSLDIPRDSQYGKTSIRFTMVLQEIFITDTDTGSTKNKSSVGALDPNVGGVD